MVAAAFAVFWALVSPMIPTPTAVHHGKQSVVAVAILATFVTANLGPMVFMAAPFAAARAPQPGDLLDLTCSRLC